MLPYYLQVENALMGERIPHGGRRQRASTAP
jgi:hypothetical protein